MMYVVDNTQGRGKDENESLSLLQCSLDRCQSDAFNDENKLALILKASSLTLILNDKWDERAGAST